MKEVQVQCKYCKKLFPLKEGLEPHLNALESDLRERSEKAEKEKNMKLIEENKKQSEIIKNFKTLEKAAVENAVENEKQKNKVEAQKSDLKLKRAEEHNLKMQKTIEEQRKQMVQAGSADQGAGQEKVLLDYLENKVFKSKKEDKFSSYGKGVKGGDVLQQVIEKGELIGKILYESKNTESFDSKWPKKLNEDMGNAKADIGIFFTRALPGYFDKDEDYHQDNNIFICKYDHTSLRTLARINRWLLIGAKKKGEKTEGNQTGIIEFFNNAENKNIITLIMKALKGIGSNLNKIKSYTDKAQSDYESSDEKLEELFEALSKVGVFFKK